MSSLASRVAVAVVGLPVVLGAVWAGGWWLFALVTVAALVAVHEFVQMARPLRPLAPAAYVGVVLGLLFFLFLASEILVYAAEVNVVRARDLVPRSLAPPPLTVADEAVLAGVAEAEQRRPEETVAVTFEPPRTE